MNPSELLNFDDLPLFNKITPEQVLPGISELIRNAEIALKEVTEPSFPAEWQAIANVLDVNTEKLNRAWSAVNHLNSVADNPVLRAVYNETLPLVTEFWTALGSNEALYAKYKNIDIKKLNVVQKEAHKKALKGFVLSGAELLESDKLKFAEIQSRLSELSQKFSENVLDATDKWTYFASEEEMRGVPEDVKTSALQAASQSGQQGYKLTLKMPCYFPVMQFAESKSLREKIYRAFATRASDQGDISFDNTKIIEETLKLRAQEAALLGFDNYAELSLATKMAKSPDEVIEFLYTLARRAKPYAERDVMELRKFALEELKINDPSPWDWTFISEKLKEARYAFSEQDLKAYFPAPKVLAGLFRIVEKLFEVNISKDSAPVWHESVEFYKIERNGALVGQFYLDPGARSGKRGGAWMDDVRARWLRPDNKKLQTPIAHLVCNFAEGINGAPPLLTHDDVITLFHEFGHGLHHLLTGRHSVLLLHRDLPDPRTGLLLPRVCHQLRWPGHGRSEQPVVPGSGSASPRQAAHHSRRGRAAGGLRGRLLAAASHPLARHPLLGPRVASQRLPRGGGRRPAPVGRRLLHHRIRGGIQRPHRLLWLRLHHRHNHQQLLHPDRTHSGTDVLHSRARQERPGSRKLLRLQGAELSGGFQPCDRSGDSHGRLGVAT